MGLDDHGEKIARIDENIKELMRTLPIIQQLDQDSAINKKEHKIAISLGGILLLPIIVWVCKLIGVNVSLF